jgi:hypothetical protein
LEVFRDGDLFQKPFFSVGEGWLYSSIDWRAEKERFFMRASYRKIYAAVVNHCIVGLSAAKFLDVLYIFISSVSGPWNTE